LPDGSESPRTGGPRFPVAGWLRVPQASNPRFPLPDGSGSLRAEGPQMPVAGWLGVGPLASDAEFPPCRRLWVFPRARGHKEIHHCRWLQKALSPVARGPSFAGWLRGFPLCQWLRVSPSPATVPGGEEISTPVRTGRTRGLRQQFQDSLAVHKPSTVNPGLSPGTDVSPPNIPQPSPQGGPARGRGRRVEGPAAGDQPRDG
jgi:hypothetical protein